MLIIPLVGPKSCQTSPSHGCLLCSFTKDYASRHPLCLFIPPLIDLSFSSEWSLLRWLFCHRNPRHHPPLPTRRLSPQPSRLARERRGARDRLVAFFFFISFVALLSLASLTDHPLFPFLCLFEVQGDQRVAFAKPDQLILRARRFGDLHLNDFHHFITKR